MNKITATVVAFFFAVIITSCWEEFSGDLIGKSGVAPEVRLTGSFEVTGNILNINWIKPDVATYAGIKLTSTDGTTCREESFSDMATSGGIEITPDIENTVTLYAIYSNGEKINEVESLQMRFSPTSGGSYILIYTMDELDYVRNNLGYSYILMADIDLSANPNWKPIGTEGDAFTGIFEGNERKIYGLKIDSSADYIGLFGSTDGAVLKNIIVSGASVSGRHNTGLLAGKALDTEVSNCHVFGSVSSNGYNVGGLVGIYFNESSMSMSNCSAVVIVSGAINVGGLIGMIYSTGTSLTVSGCFAEGSVVNSGSQSGGFAGQIGNAGIAVSNCYSTVNVKGEAYSGGFTGRVDCPDIDDISITNCYSVGSVDSSEFPTGGFVGENEGTLTNCYYDQNTSGQSDNDGRGYPRITPLMKTKGTFYGWTFPGIWSIDPSVNSGYPYLTGMAP